MVKLLRNYTYYIRRENDLWIFTDERRNLGDELPALQNWDGRVTDGNEETQTGTSRERDETREKSETRLERDGSETDGNTGTLLESG